ncbi:cobalamin B12-binding domain-containing protein [Sphingomonas jaspsi]|uniref:cobalamin B12-binding domain-containing protein n=1 Tax=Sphingomonas jaspsi TaxID=392409 RepID=UPI0004BC2336|nr:B12-binding domain-containing protein [Sphingomonas jaspsi]
MLVEGEIIPRLLFAHRNAGQRNAADGRASLSPADAQAFARLPLSLEADELLEVVMRHIDRGVSPGTIFLDLLAPSARELGRLWEEDICSFVDVTMGLWRLQEVMREVSWQAPPASSGGLHSRTALFSTMPGEQHSFGTLMINELFSRSGWQSEAMIEPTAKELLAAVGSRPFDLVGLTVTCDCPSGELGRLIKAIRSVSHNPMVRVMIGGRAVSANLAIVHGAGADGTADDAQSALVFADSLVKEAQRLTAIAR